MLDTDIAYAAGFFDGEGHVRAEAVQGRFRLTTVVTQNDRLPLEVLRTQFGGNIQGLRNRYNGSNNWVAADNIAARFLQTILPYLIVKKVDVEEALIKYQEAHASD